MSVILVLEQDAGYAGRISSLLRAAGHEVHVVQGLDHALQIASARSPELFLASGSNAGAADLLERFSRRRGGPGSVVLLPATLAEQVQAADYHADEILSKPFNESDLQAMARRFLAAEAPMPAKNQLTSADIFGDVLAEVEAEAQKSAAARRSSSSHDDINRKLEETLAGVFPMADRPRSGQSANSGAAPAQRPPTPPPSLSAPTSPSVPVPAARPLPSGLESVADAPRRARPLPPSADEIDDLLDKTLSSLELPRQRRPAAPAPAAIARPTEARPTEAQPTAPAPFAPAPAVPAPTVPAPTVPAPRAPTAAPIAAAPIAAPTVTRTAPPTVPPATVPTSAAPAAAAFRPAPPASPPNFSLPAPAPLSSAPTSSPLLPPPAPPRAAPAPPLPARPVPLEDPFAFLPPPASVAPADTAMDDSSPSFFSTPSAAFDLPNEPQLPPPRFENSGARAESFFGGDAAKPADDPWSSDVWGAAPDFSSPGPARPTTESFKAIDSAPAEAEADAWSLPPTDDTGWSVSSFDEVPTPNLKAFPEPATGQLANAAAVPHDFASAFAPPAETGSFVNPLPRPRDNSRVSTSDFGLPSESDPGLRAALDGVLQIRADHNTGKPEGDFEGTPFGDYRLMERVAIGGMAEVWRARRRGVEGFQKTVAIKKILSHLTGSVDFVTMFIDEAKLAAQLSHNNIIQIYDLGKVDDDFYIAMEYVEGWDLRTILAAGRERGLPLPMPLALAIAAAVARALDYAHRKRDFSNRALGLVHRDVSPQNVLISHEGEIKLCDFGIVKAVSKASTTQMGALKGKLQYMSPEQAWGREVDARSDIFSLGSVLFEVLTGTKLFTGDSEIGVLDAVRDCRIRSPREIVPGIQEEVERIVFRSLAKNPEDRYSTAGQLEKDITAVLDGLRLTPGQGDLAEYLQLLFNTPLLRHEPGRAIAPPLPALAPGPPEDLSGRQGVKPAKPGSAPKDGKKSPVVLIAVGVFLLLVLLILGYFLLAEKSPDEAAPATAAPTAIESATGEGATGEGTLPAAGAAAGPAEASPDVVRQMVNEQLDARQKEIEKDYDERRRKLEEELAKVQRENAKAGAKKPAGGGNSP